MGEVAGGDDADALLAGPEGQVLQVAVPAGRAGVLGVDVEVGVERHAAGLRSTAYDRRRPELEIGARRGGRLVQRESVVAARGHLVALAHVGRHPWVGHEHPRLSRDVRAEVPRVARREDGAVRDVVDVRDPVVFGLDRRFDDRPPVRPRVVEQVRDPVHVLLDRRQHVAQHRWAPGSGDREQVGEGPADARPRYMRGPSFHLSFSARSPRPRMSIRPSAPVIASKPVARTSASSSQVTPRRRQAPPGRSARSASRSRRPG